MGSFVSRRWKLVKLAAGVEENLGFMGTTKHQYKRLPKLVVNIGL